MIEIDETGMPVGDDEGEGWYPQYRRSTRWARAEYPDGYRIEIPGRHAWHAISDKDRAQALDSLFFAYAILIRDEDESRRIEKAANDGTSYLGDHDMAMLWDSVALKPDEHDEVPAERSALINVLCELELLQYRLRKEDQC